MKLNLKCKNGDIGHRVRKVGNNRVRKEKDLIKRKTRGYIEHKVRETQESIGHGGRGRGAGHIDTNFS